MVLGNCRDWCKVYVGFLVFIVYLFWLGCVERWLYGYCIVKSNGIWCNIYNVFDNGMLCSKVWWEVLGKEVIVMVKDYLGCLWIKWLEYIFYI